MIFKKCTRRVSKKCEESDVRSSRRNVLSFVLEGFNLRIKLVIDYGTQMKKINNKMYIQFETDI